MIEVEKADLIGSKVNGDSIIAIDTKYRQQTSANSENRVTINRHRWLVERGIEESILGVNPLSLSGADATSKEDNSNDDNDDTNDESNKNDDDVSDNTDDDGSEEGDGTEEEDNTDSNDDKNQKDDGTEEEDNTDSSNDDTTKSESAGNTDDANNDIQHPPSSITSNISVNVTMPLTTNINDTTDLNGVTNLLNKETTEAPIATTINNKVINVPTILSQFRNATYPVPSPLTTLNQPSFTPIKAEPTTTKIFTKPPSQQQQPKRNKRPVAVVVKPPSGIIINAPFHKTLHPIQQHKQQQQHNSVPSSSSSSTSCTTKFSLYCSYPISTSIGGTIIFILFICYCCCSCCRTNRNDMDTSRGEYRRVTSRFTADAFDDTIDEDDDDDYNNDGDDDDAGATYTNGKHVIELQNLDKGKLSIHEVNG